MPTYKTVTEVLLGHCDSGGIVFLPRYFDMLHQVIEGWFDEALDWPMSQMIGADKLHIPVRTISADYPYPARLGDRLIWKLNVEDIGDTSLTLNIRAVASNEGATFCAAKVTLVLSELDVMRTRRWSQSMRARLEGYRAAA